MLLTAGILFVIAGFLWVIDKLIDNANVDLTWWIRVLIAAAMILILLDVLLNKTVFWAGR
jgi:hypothetical protein